MLDELLKLYARLSERRLMSGEDGKILDYVRTRLAREIDSMLLMKQAQVAAQTPGQLSAIPKHLEY